MEEESREPRYVHVCVNVLRECIVSGKCDLSQGEAKTVSCR